MSARAVTDRPYSEHVDEITRMSLPSGSLTGSGLILIRLGCDQRGVENRR